MNSRQLQKLGLPDDPAVIKAALAGIQSASKAGVLRSLDLKATFAEILAAPQAHQGDDHFGPLAAALVEYAREPLPAEPIGYRTWGTDIDAAAHQQMRVACEMPMAAAAALMPDAHVGYGLPIGGVLALANAVCPYAVGVDIACRMKLSVFDMPVSTLTDEGKFSLYRDALEKGTRFGVGAEYKRPQQHEVMDEDWTVTAVTAKMKDRAWSQLGTSGSGNHFVEFGELIVTDAGVGLDPGRYVALLSHSGSRGTGAQVADHYSKLARELHPELPQELSHLAWLDLSTEPGQKYWAAMELMGHYAAANHAVIHRHVVRALGVQVLLDVENHHNFAWREKHVLPDGSEGELIVHRKGATPAAEGVLGIIPGSMGTPGYVVRGKGVAASLNSAAHGAGRRMSRKKAKQTFSWDKVQEFLRERNVTLISAGLDEVPMAYKDIDAVMAAQSDLVERLARFEPRLVKMAASGEPPED
jgi:tRNA-splicing ligase RtcB